MKYGEKTITIEGEAYERGYGSPDFVAVVSSMRSWDEQKRQYLLDNATREKILIGLKQRIIERNMTIGYEL